MSLVWKDPCFILGEGTQRWMEQPVQLWVFPVSSDRSHETHHSPFIQIFTLRGKEKKININQKNNKNTWLSSSDCLTTQTLDDLILIGWRVCYCQITVWHHNSNSGLKRFAAGRLFSAFTWITVMFIPWQKVLMFSFDLKRRHVQYIQIICLFGLSWHVARLLVEIDYRSNLHSNVSNCLVLIYRLFEWVRTLAIVEMFTLVSLHYISFGWHLYPKQPKRNNWMIVVSC